MKFADVVTTSAAVAATSSRSAKRDALAGLLRRLGPDEVEPVVGFLVGEPRQGRIGVGWRTISAAARPPAPTPTLSVATVDRTLSEIAALTGPGSAQRRLEALGALLGAATEPEASFLARLLVGELRQGALEGVMVDAVAAAAEVPVATVRRAVMLGGRLDTTARLALSGGVEALGRVGLEVGRPVQPMLASTAPSVREAVDALGSVSVEWKLDGIRVQVHLDDGQVRVWTRNLNEVTDRLPGVVATARSLGARRAVLDGEVIGIDADGRLHLFQDTVSWRGDGTAEHVLRPFFFDVLHLDGEDLVDAPLPDLAEAVLEDALAAGHEGVVVKDAGSAYEAGRRGKAWRKVKPVHTLDLVVLAAEWGHGRRRGWLSNLHLGARATGSDGFVMVGKTFKGLTDELLRWQTARFLELAEREEHWDGPGTGVVWVRPEQVVEVAVDGVQRSPRYPGGVALRFARVVRYRDDKVPADADTIETVRALLPGGSG
ncbi:MAG TPA: hypothetical protein VKZ55_04400 [Microthrixaceae bacterium]|nr:hypothetical protein [Microthrixaceae bacterium]